MPVTLTGRGLTLEDVVAVARDREPVELAPDALAAMEAARAVVERALGRGAEIYGITTGVGMRKAFRVSSGDHDRVLVRQHLIAQGTRAPDDVVRATTLCLANVLARGATAARPELAHHVVQRLNADSLPHVRTLGSVGQGDLAPLADLAAGLLDGFEPVVGEAIALLNENAFASGWGALALRDALVVLDALDVAGALDLEAFGANRDLLDPAIGEERPYPGLRTTLDRLTGLVAGSAVEPRTIQDPLSFRTLPHVHGAARDAFGFVRTQVEIELNAAQSNPLVVREGDRVVSVGNFEALPLATALDVARLALAPPLTSAAERAVKLLQSPLTGLNEGLGARPGLAESALSELGIAVQAFAAEARLLAQPVSLELVSTTQAEGIEDRTTMAPLAARRLAEMAELGARVVSVELLLAAQACDLRGSTLGTGTAAARDAVRERAPFVGEGDPLPDLEPLVDLVRTGSLAGIAAS
ncbi:MAG TPA: aromatic amino acid lyase [Gaiella sp.]